MMDWKDGWKRWMSAGLLLICIAMLAVLFKAYLEGKFNSVDTLQRYVAGFGLLAAIDTNYDSGRTSSHSGCFRDSLDVL